jgi:TRAP-type C4-dicarboxylate transport system permease small subunit
MGRAADWLAIAAGWGLLLYSIAVGVEVISRRYLGFSLQGVDEIGGYLMAVVVAVGFTCALYSRGHIRIDILFSRFSRSTTLWLNVSALAGLIAFAAFLLWQAIAVVLQSRALRAVAPTPLQTPLVIPQVIWVAALLFFLVAALTLFVQVLRYALRRDATHVAAMLGTSAGRAESGGPR